MRTILCAAAIAAVSLLSTTSAFAIGAIAVDDEHGLSAEQAGYGIGWGSTEAEASSDAMAQCQSIGNTNCRVEVWFESCGAYAGNRTQYGIGWGASLADAESMALANCPGCRIAVSECE
jgi:hypothetical protein